MSKNKIENMSAEQRARLERAATLPDSEIDTSDIPGAPPGAWTETVVGRFYRPRKEVVIIRLDADLVEYLKRQAGGDIRPPSTRRCVSTSRRSEEAVKGSAAACSDWRDGSMGLLRPGPVAPPRRAHLQDAVPRRLDHEDARVACRRTRVGADARRLAAFRQAQPVLAGEAVVQVGCRPLP